MKTTEDKRIRSALVSPTSAPASVAAMKEARPCHCYDDTSRKFCLDRNNCTPRAEAFAAIDKIDVAASAPSDAVREALDNSQSLLVSVYGIGPHLSDWKTEDVDKQLEDQIAKNRAALTASEGNAAPGPSVQTDASDLTEADDTSVGGITWHSSEEDGGPDVGVSVRLGPDDRLWCGEIPRKRFEECGGAEHFDSDGGWFIVRYSGNETTLIAKCADKDAAREFIEQVAAWVIGSNVTREPCS